MTFKEKWDLEHPDNPYKPGNLGPGCVLGNFPEIRGLGNIGRRCMATNCEDCWDSEMTAYKIDEEYEEKLTNETAPMWPKNNPHILDSGERRQFETGAVRDIQKGKGRCDLMPLEVLCKYFKKPIFGLLGMFLKDCNTAHLYECIRLFSSYYGEKTNTATDCTMFLEVAKHFEEGAKKYGENNWQKGLPVHCYIDSAVRHYLKWLRGDKDEPHDRAFVRNLVCCIWECDFSPRAKASGDSVTLYADDAPVDHIPSCLIRYGDCPAGLFEYDNEGVFVKTEILDGDSAAAETYIAVRSDNGTTRRFDNDALVRPIGSNSLLRDAAVNEIHERANIDRCADMVVELFEHSTQDLILIEEMSELAKALLKLRRGKSSMNEIAEEMAHVLISVEVVRRILGIDYIDLEKEACKKLSKNGYEGTFIIDDTPRSSSETEQDVPIMVLEHVTKARPDQVLYLCDRLACPECDNPECSHTEDVKHAINFESVESDGASEGRRFVERCNSQLLLKNSAPGVYEVFGHLCLKGADSALYDMATGCPINATGFTYGKSMSLVDMYLGVEGLILGTAPGGALFYHNDCVWLRTTMTNTDDGSVYAVRLCDGKPERISGKTLVTSVEDLDFK